MRQRFRKSSAFSKHKFSLPTSRALWIYWAILEFLDGKSRVPLIEEHMTDAGVERAEIPEKRRTEPNKPNFGGTPPNETHHLKEEYALQIQAFAKPDLPDQ